MKNKGETFDLKRLFISQPMRGKTEEQILLTREIAMSEAQRILGEDVEVIQSYFRGVNFNSNNPLYLLGKSLELLATADAVYFAPGYEDARGCRIEKLCALEYGIPVIEEYK